MPQYMLLFHETPDDFAAYDDDELGRIYTEYATWRDALIAEGRHLGSNKLRFEAGRAVRGRGGKVRVTDGPFAEAKEVVGGYALIRADSYDAAVAVARSCPHLRYGQWIEVRAVDLVEDSGSDPAGRLTPRR